MSMHSRTYVVAFAGVAVLLSIAVWTLGKENTPAAYAQRSVDACTGARELSACYEEIVPRLYPELAIQDLFEVVRIIRHLDPSYQFCHVLAHKLGERVVAEDPGRWVEAIALNPADGLCSNGFVHGVTGGRFRAEVLSDETIERYLADFTAACAPRSGWDPSDLDRAICYHGMGHLYDFITNADIDKALSLCGRTTPHAYQRTCIEGVFMQIYQPLEPDDFELIAQMDVQPSTTTVRSYCASFKKPEYVGACLRESWPFFQEGIRDGSVTGQFCTGHPDAERTEQCYEAMSALVGRMSLDNPEGIAAACAQYPQEWRWMCFSYAAESALQENRNEAAQASTICSLAAPEEESRCYGHLLSHARFTFGNKGGQYRAFCDALPSDWSRKCWRQLSAGN